MAYDIHTDVKYRPLELVDAGKLADDCKEPWWNQSLCLVNDCVARIGVFHGEFHWHKHDREDELFFVLEGTLLLDLEERTVVPEGAAPPRPIECDSTGPHFPSLGVAEPARLCRTVELGPKQGMVVPRGVVHRTRAPSRTVVLMVEAATVVPTGD